MHVVVLGGGYAGLTLTRELEKRVPTDADIELTLVNDSPDHLVQHELHRVLRRPELANAITVSLPAVLDRATVRVARVEAIDRERRTVRLSDGTLPYDIAAVCLGARTATHGIAGVRKHATPFKRLADAFAVRARAREALREHDDTETPFVVCGAGLSGIQVAGELAALAREGHGSNADATLSITLIEQFDTVAPQFDSSFQRAVTDTLESAGVTVRTGTAVTRVTPSAVGLESGEELPAECVVWTGGIRGTDALDRERPPVGPALELDERTFVLGDAARVTDAEGEAVPASAQSAMQAARALAPTIARLVSDERDVSDEHAQSRGTESVSASVSANFAFDSPGWVVSVGDEAVAQVGSNVLTGRGARLLKTGVRLRYLAAIGAADRAAVLAREEVGRRLPFEFDRDP
ncbi:FAD-dependent pyridine nucleotide-disulfide oxidoreductase [Natrialba hulunbeirensis JCM 10989]|uniref:FAD-dependent pyridine nucleotide-disulfide oxidoreductase n=1 Tax=Natrialba hulunbeirensis JCM 10989 TaxID=1227493 RepID=L9ZNQ9_9EURY|nr:FAD-dependent oxidoreductase [Natrialba hulunbeirensis]ELY87701.1 FAD-dependent pyridine nucleotide-disulfide oxidoreductase [Natrialba hulunbeirensis JCM 10989]